MLHFYHVDLGGVYVNYPKVEDIPILYLYDSDAWSTARNPHGAVYCAFENMHIHELMFFVAMYPLVDYCCQIVVMNSEEM